MAKETFRILFFINKSSLKNNGLTTIMIRITINGNSTQFNSKLEIDPNYWNQKFQCATKGPYLYINNELSSIRNEIQGIYFNLLSKLQYVSVVKLKESYLLRDKEMYITYQFEQQIENTRTSITQPLSSETKKHYKLTLSRLLCFISKKYKKTDIFIYEIDLSFLNEFYSFLKNEYKISNNSATKYMKRFAAIINYAHKTKLLQINPFEFYTFHQEKTTWAYLDPLEVNIIAKKNISIPRLSRIRDMFIFCCYTGLSYSELCKIKLSDIQYRNNRYWLVFPSQKSNIIVTVPLITMSICIIKKYHPNFPSIKKLNISIFKSISNSKANKYLKELCEMCNITKSLSFHCARITFATIASNNNISIDSISKMLGHSSIRTTERYIVNSRTKIENEIELMDKMFF